ncbi:uncharacterized protein LOC106364844 [Brassica napus]|uniref:uncharacterized protein LOC106364844 n=1 Tax=Brassica napus TaxID=3708 RepID=UPI0006AB72FF|nr:uncharacterized protein LOC106364844 [Brassica napus]
MEVCDASDNAHWRLGGGRIRVFQDIIEQIQERPVPVNDLGPDIVLWKHNQDDYKEFFSATRTWEQIRVRRERVDWSTVVWFTQAVPRFSFITWLAIKDRLSTGERMRVWGLHQECLLCGERNETRDHLFFACPYSYMVWLRVTGRLFGTRITPDWQDTVARIRYDRRSKLDTVLVRMVFQMTVYHIWRERNARRHGKAWIPYEKLTSQIDKTMRNRISSLKYSYGDKLAGLMRRWFEVTM